MRSNYWSCTKFADWIRGTAKLKAGTSEEWDNWTTTAQMKHDFRFWLAEDGIDYVQKFVFYIPDKLHAVKYYINNRWVTKTHQLTAHPKDIKPGNWHDVGNRFLPCLFNELVEFVEVELAWWQIAWAGKEEKAKYAAPWWSSGWFRWRVWRCKQAGIDNLDWQRNLHWSKDDGFKEGDPQIGKITPQAVKAQEILDLYNWWTTVYRNRPDPYDASGWSAYCEASRLAHGGKVSWDFSNKTPELKKMSNKAHKLLQKIEAEYEKEDEQMMIRLIKVRHGLWT